MVSPSAPVDKLETQYLAEPVPGPSAQAESTLASTPEQGPEINSQGSSIDSRKRALEVDEDTNDAHTPSAAKKVKTSAEVVSGSRDVGLSKRVSNPS